MKNDQEEFNDYLVNKFKPILTKDGSFTLKQIGLKEKMHALGGALSESIFIYFYALEQFFKDCRNGEEVEILSIGLGMGYNEILSAYAYLNTGLNLKLTILSFEKEEKLELLFKKRLLHFDKYPLFWQPFKAEGVEVFKVAAFLKDNLKVNKKFDEKSLQKLNNVKRIVLFDAYSNKTSKELWREGFLKNLIIKCEKGSVFTTYAATGVLNRILKKSGFKNLKRDGFLYKRDSTLALKI